MSIKVEADQGISSDHLLDLYIRDYTFKAHDQHLIRTGILHSVRLPANFSGIRVDMVRLRCGSLRRYGARVREFHLEVGVTVHPCVERVMVVRQNLGYNWSSIFYANYDISGYQLVSPILGLLAYNAGSNMNFSDPFELGILAEDKPITVDFSNTTKLTNTQAGNRPYCASFESDGKVTLANQVSPYVCVAKRHGHFGLVIEMAPEQLRKNISRSKLVVGSSVGAALGAILLGMLLVALLVKVKKKSRMEEMERRAYEEEALQVSMVGHVRAPTAAVTRTLPTIEHEYAPSPQGIVHFCL